MNKRGLSNVIVTLILIAISLIAVGLVWVTVQNLIESETEQISLGFITVNLEIKDVKVESDGSVKIKVGRKIGEGDITGLKFIVSDGVNTETIDKENVDLDQLEEKTFTLTSGELGEVVFVKEISVAPVFTLESGKEKIGSVVDIDVLTNKQIIENLGAVSWWRFDGNARDEIGDNDGTLNGDVSFVDGKFGKSASFDGSGDYVEVGSDSSLNVGTALTYSVWLKRTSDSLSQWPMIASHGNTHNYYGIRSLAWGDTISFEYGLSPYDGTSFANLIFGGTGSLPINEWHYFSVTYDGSTLTNYRDGVYITQKNNVILNPNFDKVRVGSAGGSFNGLIDEVIIFNKALSDKEVKALYELDFD